ncbi:alanine racemase [Rivularia sp. PCC 7116]|uniref:alanine racemase n=1 Tax=Rivularia sp. PCC 7116 TaxID=373994 RepID=UPI00029F112F|nr:alanine racemase [Rivularia sp. PCC 7116]AFY53266.1 alanine racemase [Rivularia sp. PCC 7116]
MNQHHIEVIVSADKFKNNISYIRERVQPSELCVVMKANAYGHGLKDLAPTAVAAGADYIGICTNPEATIIRDLGLDVKLLRLRMALSQELQESIESLNIEEQIGSIEAANYLSEAGINKGKKIPVHINIDTGMGRSGFYSNQIDELKRVCGLSGIDIVGIMTHFASSDGEDLDFTRKQIEDFYKAREVLKDYVDHKVLTHTHNSAATVRVSNESNRLVRVGAACYGVRTSQDFENPPELEPVMSVKTRVAQVRQVPKGKTIGYGSLFTTQRDSLIASLPVGFGEGYPRSLFNKGIVLIKGYRCPVVGRVSLNITTVDITDIPEPVEWGDEVVLIGTQGSEEITFEELADKFASVHTEINLMAGFMNQVSYV